MKKLIPIITLSILFIFVLCSCSKEVTINILDSGKTLTVQAKTGTKVSTVLENARISVATQDEVSPSLDTEITDESTEIVIKRYAKVTVIKGKDSKIIKITGGTVQDAVDKSGFGVKDGEELDHNANDFLTNGMVIKILREVTVTLTVDGETKNFKPRLRV